MKSVTVIIPNYNGEEILKENLPVILTHVRKYCAQVIVVDDKSTDNSVKVLKEIFPQVKLIQKEKNQGFSSTVNKGVAECDTELVCLLNSDIITTENFLDPILPYFSDETMFGVGMCDLADDGDTHGRGKFICDHGFILHKKYESEKNSLKSGVTGWVSCGSGVFSKKAWDRLGGLDELLNPFYFEDVDIGYRAWKAGYKLMFEEKAIVEHKHKKGAIKTHYQEEKIKTISYRNQIYTTATNLTDTDLYINFLISIPQNIAIAIKNNDKAFLKAVKECIKNLNKVDISRKLKKKTATRTDHQVLDMFKE